MPLVKEVMVGGEAGAEGDALQIPACLQIGSDRVLGIGYKTSKELTPCRPRECLQGGGVPSTYSLCYVLSPGVIFKFLFAGLPS